MDRKPTRRVVDYIIEETCQYRIAAVSAQQAEQKFCKLMTPEEEQLLCIGIVKRTVWPEKDEEETTEDVVKTT